MAYTSGRHRSASGFSQRSALGIDLESQQQLQVRVEPRSQLDAEITGLSAQVKKLKEVSNLISGETRQQNDILAQLEQTMVTAEAAVKEGIRKINKVLTLHGGSHVLHVILFALGAFFLVYLWMKFT